MALTYQQMNLVKGTIPVLREKGELIAATFYKNMLDENPELHPYFNTVNQKNGRQPRALTAVILNFASNIMHISELIPLLERMCNKHCSLNIKPEHYNILFKYLMQTFSQMLGPAMTPEVEVAWTKAYWVLAKMMIAREAQLYAGFEKWVGWRKFKISRKVEESDNMYSFYLVPKDGTPLPGFFPGQYVSLQVSVPNINYAQSRQYTLSDSPKPDCYRITVKRDEGLHYSNAVSMTYLNPGLVSNLLIDEIRVGDVIDVSHPAGEFFLDTKNGSSVPLVLISAGAGVAPMVSILNTVMESQPQREVSWIQGARRAVPFEDHLREIKRTHPNVRTNIFKTQLADRDLAGVMCDFNVRVDLAKVSPADLFLDHGGTEYYVCGPEQFMVEIAEYLRLEGVELGRVKFELFSTGVMAAST